MDAAATDFAAIATLIARFYESILHEGMLVDYGRFSPTPVLKRAPHPFGFDLNQANYRVRHIRMQSTGVYDRFIRPGPVLEPVREEDYPLQPDIQAADFKHGRIHEDLWVSP